jgi:hypothetical protein
MLGLTQPQHHQQAQEVAQQPAQSPDWLDSLASLGIHPHPPLDVDLHARRQQQVQQQVLEFSRQEAERQSGPPAWLQSSHTQTTTLSWSGEVPQRQDPPLSSLATGASDWNLPEQPEPSAPPMPPEMLAQYELLAYSSGPSPVPAFAGVPAQPPTPQQINDAAFLRVHALARQEADKVLYTSGNDAANVVYAHACTHWQTGQAWQDVCAQVHRELLGKQ